MDGYVFDPRNLYVNRRSRVKKFFIINHDNRALYRQFKSNFHLDKLEAVNISYHLPKKYLVETNEVTYFYNMRDKVLTRVYRNEYAKIQSNIDEAVKEQEKEHSFLKDQREKEKKELTKLRNKKASHSDDVIALEALTSEAEARLDNTNKAIKDCENKISNLIRTRKDNLARWRSQVKILEKNTEITINNYTKMATRSIESKYGFTNFVHDIAKYDNDMQKVIKGDYKDA